MAITLQIIKLDCKLIEICSSSEDALHELISFELGKEEDQFDFDWAAKGIETYLNISNQITEIKEAYQKAIKGISLVNLKHPNNAKGYFVESNITKLPLSEVAEIAKYFNRMNWKSLKNILPINKEEACKKMGVSLNCHPNDYYLSIFKKFVNFYQEAASKKLCIVLWWD